MTKKIEATAAEKSGRVVRETSMDTFVSSVNAIKEILNAEDFVTRVCEFTDNGKYKVTDTKPADMNHVKVYEDNGVKWYKVPTTDDRTAITTYIRFRMNKEKTERNNALKSLAGLTTEELIALAAKMQAK